MARIVIELTNRCNLRCRHCYDERHASTGDLPLAIAETVVRDAAKCGIDHICFSGGEPTLHSQFASIVARVSEAGYQFSFVSNGRDFQAVSRLVARYGPRFRGVTFSLDGARESTHDRLRGRGSYRQVMRAAMIALSRQLPFTFNCVLTRENRDQIAEMIDLVWRLGSRGIRFGHLMVTPHSPQEALALSPAERREVEGHVKALAPGAPVHVAMAPGYFSESPFFPCGPLQLDEYHVDHRGNLVFCCHLSGYAGPNAGRDVIGNLADITLEQGCSQFGERVSAYLADKRERVRQGTLTELDYFPCWYCVKYMGKVAVPDASPLEWRRAQGTDARRTYVALAADRKATR
jgi:MoaA/NifB/PqqE/SkfB family radical SAM enzyme